MFDEVNSSQCFCANKPNFGPYNCPKCSLDIIVLISDV